MEVVYAMSWHHLKIIKLVMRGMEGESSGLREIALTNLVVESITCS